MEWMPPSIPSSTSQSLVVIMVLLLQLWGVGAYSLAQIRKTIVKASPAWKVMVHVVIVIGKNITLLTTKSLRTLEYAFPTKPLIKVCIRNGSTSRKRHKRKVGEIMVVKLISWFLLKHMLNS